MLSGPVFRRFWIALAVTVTGSWVTFVALPLLVYQRTGSAFQTALLTALEIVPYLVFGLVAGAVADRVDRRKLMMRAALGTAASRSTSTGACLAKERACVWRGVQKLGCLTVRWLGRR